MRTRTIGEAFSKMTRRHFMGGLIAAAGLTTACSTGDEALYTEPRRPDMSGGTWHKSFCGSCIWTNCATEVKVVNGVAVEIRGNKDHPSNKGTLCPRGAAQLMNLYNPYRLQTPLKRTNPNKGLDEDPGWVAISWDEAIDTVVEKIKTAQAIDPRRLMIMYGFASNLHETPFIKGFTTIFGNVNYAMSCGPLCEVHHAPALYNATFVDRVDMEHCNYLIAFGRNLGASGMFASGPGRALADAVERGMKIVSIDPHAGADISKSGSEWVPITPGTDTAFAMAMLHHMLITKKFYDEDAVKNRSNGPYLVKDDGHYLRVGDTGTDDAILPIYDLAGVQTNVPLVRDYDGTIKPFYDAIDPQIDFTGTVVYNGQNFNVTTGFRKLKESVVSATTTWAAAITGVPAETIERITEELMAASLIDPVTRTGPTKVINGVTFPFRPVTVSVGRGSANNIQGMRFYVLADMINLVLGAIGVPGSLVCAAGPKMRYEDGMMRENPVANYTTAKSANFNARNYTGQQYYPLARFPILGASMQAIIDPAKYHINDHEIDVYFPYGANPFINDADAEITEQAFKKIPFMFTFGYHLDETSLFCDIIMPEHSHYERNQIRPVEETMAVNGETIDLIGINYKEAAVDLVYNTRQFDDVLIEIANRTGHGEMINFWYNLFYGLNGTEYQLDLDKQYSYQEMMDHRLKAFTGDGRGVDWFRENGFLTKKKPLETCYEYHLMANLAGSNGKRARLPLYNWRDYVAGKYLEKNLTDNGFAAIPGWEGKMDKVYEEYTPVPIWRDNFLTDYSAEFNLTVTNWKVSLRMLGLGAQDDNPWLREAVEKMEFDDLRIQINPKTAASIGGGLKDGDKVRVTSQHGGSVEGVLKITSLIKEDVLGFPGQGGRVCKFMNPISRKGSNYNRLLTYKEGYFMGDNGSISVGARVKINKI